MIYTIRELEKGITDPSVIGTKASRLLQLATTLSCVPTWICVGTEAMNMLFSTAEGRALADLIDMYLVNKVGLYKALPSIRRRITMLSFPGTFLDQIGEALTRSGIAGPFAVRSSTPFEDTSSQSWAGMFDTILDVGVDDIPSAILQCWASLYSERALMYCNRTKITHRDFVTAVIIQQMIKPQKSGVVFTINPVTSNRMEMIIEAASGVGEGVVSGREKVARYYFDKMNRCFRADGIDTSLLGETELRAIAEAAEKAEEVAGAGQDVEWAVENRRVVILQSRPITTLKDDDVDDARIVPMYDLRDSNEKYLRNLRGRYKHWQKKKIPFYRACHEHGVPMCGWYFISFRRSQLDNVLCDSLMGRIHSPYVYLCVSENIIDIPIRRDQLLPTLKEIGDIFQGHPVTVGIRESYPTEVSVLSHVTGSDHVYIEYVPGAIKGINSGDVIASSLVVDESGRVLKDNRIRNKYVSKFDDERMEFVEVKGDVEVVLVDRDIVSIVEHTNTLTREYAKRIIVEWWKWKDVLLVTDASIVDMNHDDTETQDSEYLVVSAGVMSGRVIKIADYELDAVKYLSHGRGLAVLGIQDEVRALGIMQRVRQRISEEKEQGENVLLYLEKPYLFFAPLAELADGFIFGQASLLCHLSIILREKCIPAISLQGRKCPVEDGAFFALGE